ncbi:MAG: glycosyltransferase [Chloroflexi bacterium SZAS-1]|nr:glycosyltransferase [Chloroflexi bacterium SZAS-1]
MTYLAPTQQQAEQIVFESARQATATSPADVNVLILNTHLPIFPGGGGVEYLTTLHLASLAPQVGLVSMAHTRADLQKVQGLAEAGAELYLWESPHLDASPVAATRPTAVRQVHTYLRTLVDIFKAGFTRPVDTIVLDGCFRNMAPGLQRALAERPWQALAVIESSAARMIDYLPRQTASVLVMHDVRALVYQRQAATSAHWWQRQWLLYQARRYYAFERAYCQRYDLVTTVSEEDAAWVRAHYRPRKIAVVPLPVDAEYFQPQPGGEVANRIVFTGLMNHPPNADAAIYFAREVLPHIRAIQPDAEFFVVGRHPTAAVQELDRLPGVHVTGGVPDIRPFIASAAVVVVPLRYGSGARQKILEAWGMEKCVVSTTIGAEGLAYDDGINLAIADDTASLAAAVTQALQSPSYRDNLRFAGRAVVLDRHNPLRVAANYYQEVQSAVVAAQCHMPPMRVAIDMRWMLPGMAGGLENLARSFMRELLALDYHNHYTAILPARVAYDFDLRGHTNVQVVSKDSVRAYTDRALAKLLRVVHARLHLDYWKSPEVANLLFARALDADIAYSFPGYIHPDVYPLRQVLMVPDIQHEFLPEFFSEAALEERRRLYGDAIRRADHICAISEFTRQTLIERLGVAPEKITAIPLAADPIFAVASAQHEDKALLQRYGLQLEQYLFFPAHTWHHKNHRTALAALRVLRDRYGYTPLLICTGGMREAQPELEQHIEAEGLRSQVRFLGYVPRADLPALYRGAASLLFPSLFEGFGMPVLEAMASGCPVVCSNTTSLPEIAGDAALQANPRDPEAFADALAQVLRDAELRALLRTRGYAQAAKFSWQRHTIETLGVFYRVHQQLHQR